MINYVFPTKKQLQFIKKRKKKNKKAIQTQTSTLV